MTRKSSLRSSAAKAGRHGACSSRRCLRCRSRRNSSRSTNATLVAARRRRSRRTKLGLCAVDAPASRFVLAVVAVFLAAFRDWRPHLGPGERGTIMVIAADRRQARVIMRYVAGLLRWVPMLAQLIESETHESVLICATASSSRFTPHRSAQRAATPSLLACWTNWHSGRRRRQCRARRTRCSTRCVPAWRRFPARCCCVRLALRPPRCVVRCAPQALRQGRRSGSGVARADAGR